MFLSGALLFYGAFLLPVQLFMWDYSDPCNTFPTLRLDLFADTFFLVMKLRVVHTLTTYSWQSTPRLKAHLATKAHYTQITLCYLYVATYISLPCYCSRLSLIHI